MAVCRTLLPYIGWLLLGFITGLHWLAFIPGLCFNPYKHYGLFSLKAILGHLVTNWIANGLFWVFRETMQPWYIPCRGGESMSPACLFHEQEARYTTFYVIHLVLLLFVIVKWIVDAALLWKWIRRSDEIAAGKDKHSLTTITVGHNED